MIIELTIPGAPRTKKNHGRVVMRGGRKLHLPSEAYSDYRARVLPLLKQWQAACLKRPLAIALNCTATFYRDADRGDAVGYYQGLADLLQEAGIVQDDKFIVSWDGSRLAMVQKVRTDTNELLETRPPTEIDKQRIDLQRQRSLPGMGGGEVRSEPREPKGKQRRTEEVTGSVH